MIIRSFLIDNASGSLYEEKTCCWSFLGLEVLNKDKQQQIKFN